LDYFFYVLLVFGVFTILYLNASKTITGLPSFANGLNGALLLFVIFAMALSPIVIYGDKYNYEYIFNNIDLENSKEAKDMGWFYYTYYAKMIFNDSSLYFLLTAFVYALGYYIFAKKYIPYGTIFIFLLACFSSFGFLAYGINTIRAGFSMALLLIALTVIKKKPLFVFFAVFAVLCHKSMALPLIAFLWTKYHNVPKTYLRIWLLALVISFINVGFITGFVESSLGSFDERSSAYFGAEDTLVYNSDFRVDFIIYSALPILLGFYYIVKLKINDLFYNRLFNTYLLVNAFWILAIRMDFTDRVAYLSWFLMPFILLYPLLKYKLPINSRKLIGIILLGILSFTTFMQFK